MPNSILIRKLSLSAVLFLTVLPTQAIAEKIVGGEGPFPLNKNPKSADENRAFLSPRTGIDDSMGDDKVVRSLLRELTSVSSEPIVYVPRAHVPTRSLWGQHYERDPYPRPSPFRSGGSWRHTNKEAGNGGAPEDGVPKDGIVLDKRELRQRRLNSLRVSKYFPEVHPPKPRTVDHYFPSDGKVEGDAKDEGHPPIRVGPPSVPPTTDLSGNTIHFPLKVAGAEVVPKSPNAGIRTQVQTNEHAENIRQDPKTKEIPLPPVRAQTQEARSSFFAWPPSWWPFSTSCKNSESGAEITPETQAPITDSQQPPPQPAAKGFRFIPKTRSEPPPNVGAEQGAPPGQNLNSVPVVPKEEPTGEDEHGISAAEATTPQNTTSTPIELKSTNQNTETGSEPMTIRFVPVELDGGVASPIQNLLTTDPGSQILIPVPIRFLPANDPLENKPAPDSKPPEKSESPTTTTSKLTEPTTPTTPKSTEPPTPTTPKPTEPPKVTTMPTPKSSPAPIGYEIEFVPVASKNFRGETPLNQIEAIGTPPRFRHLQIPRPLKIVNNFNPRFQLNETPSRNAEKFRTGSSVPFLPSQPPIGQFREGLGGKPPMKVEEKQGRARPTTNGEYDVLRTLKDGSRLLRNGIVVPAGYKCPFAK